MMRAGITLFALALAACGPMSVQRAEEVCFERALDAKGPRGTISVGAGTNGPSAGIEMSVSSDYLTGRDPSEVYSTCVMTKSGQPPSRPLYDLPGWKN